ncbi:hypothetical protein Pelo_13264, partial [Pelomyxa schiedti]
MSYNEGSLSSFSASNKDEAPDYHQNTTDQLGDVPDDEQYDNSAASQENDNENENENQNDEEKEDGNLETAVEGDDKSHDSYDDYDDYAESPPPNEHQPQDTV